MEPRSNFSQKSAISENRQQILSLFARPMTYIEQYKINIINLDYYLIDMKEAYQTIRQAIGQSSQSILNRQKHLGN